MGTTIRTMHLTELEEIYKRITEDFPVGEYPPYDKLYQQIKNSIQKGWVLVQEGSDAAYCICAEGNGHVLISFFAVYSEYRGSGVGTIFLEKIKELYSNSNGIIVEVEKTEAAIHEEDVFVRERRLEFYRRAGFSLVLGIDYVIWDVPMHLMVYPCKSSLTAINNDIENIMFNIYLSLLGKLFIHKLKIKKS